MLLRTLHRSTLYVGRWRAMSTQQETGMSAIKGRWNRFLLLIHPDTIPEALTTVRTVNQESLQIAHSMLDIAETIATRRKESSGDSKALQYLARDGQGRVRFFVPRPAPLPDRPPYVEVSASVDAATIYRGPRACMESILKQADPVTHATVRHVSDPTEINEITDAERLGRSGMWSGPFGDILFNKFSSASVDRSHKTAVHTFSQLVFMHSSVSEQERDDFYARLHSETHSGDLLLHCARDIPVLVLPASAEYHADMDKGILHIPCDFTAPLFNQTILQFGPALQSRRIALLRESA